MVIARTFGLGYVLRIRELTIRRTVCRLRNRCVLRENPGLIGLRIEWQTQETYNPPLLVKLSRLSGHRRYLPKGISLEARICENSAADTVYEQIASLWVQNGSRNIRHNRYNRMGPRVLGTRVFRCTLWQAKASVRDGSGCLCERCLTPFIDPVG